MSDQPTRAENIASGRLTDISESATSMGMRWPTAMSKDMWFEVIAAPDAHDMQGEVEADRLYEALVKAVDAMQRPGNQYRDRAFFEMQQEGKEAVLCWVKCHPGDDGEPVLTLLLSTEE